MEQFKPGDMVQLKSGGPIMTIEKIEGEQCWAQWFDGKELKRGLFYLASLQKYVEPQY